MVQRALNSLPIHYRTAVTLCDIENLSYEQMGEVMSCPLGTVRSRVHEGRRLLRKAFEKLYDKGRVESHG
jgi:RNA polymerase sigma-70 factor (ECF subfamily)